MRRRSSGSSATSVLTWAVQAEVSFSEIISLNRSFVRFLFAVKLSSTKNLVASETERTYLNSFITDPVDLNLYSLPNVSEEFAFTELHGLQDLAYTSVKKLSTIRGIEQLSALTYLGLSRVKVLDGDYEPIRGLAHSAAGERFAPGAPEMSDLLH